MSHLTKVAGTWRNSKPYTKVAGTWKLADYVYNKVGGRWYTSFVKGGLVDKSWDDRDQTGVFGTGVSSLLGYATTMTLQSDGKILVGGSFSQWNGTNVGYIARLNSDGTLDTTFTTNTGTGADTSFVNAIAVQSDGKILIGGSFTYWNGTLVRRIVRLNSDGTLDTAFTTNTGTGALSTVYAIAVQSDGKILISGSFTSWNGTNVGRIVRLNSDGTRDTAFTTNTGTGANGSAGLIAIQSDGKILVGGSFSSWNGTSVGYIVRLNSDGTLDTTFTTNIGTGANSSVQAIAIQSDGKILVSGLFTTWKGTTVGRIVRLNSDGTRDTTFTTKNGTGANNAVNAMIIQSDGKILVGGSFPRWNGTLVNRIVRLDSDGTRDTAFTANTGTGANSNVGSNSIAIQSDGKILLGGDLTTWNGTTVNRIVRLNSDGTRDTAFTTNTGTGAGNTVYQITVQPDGKILVGGSFTTWNGTTVNRIVRLNSDGTRDTTFTTNNGTGASSTVSSIAVQSDGKIIIGGFFTSWNGTTVGRIVRLNSDGTRDTAFTTNTGTGANYFVYLIAIQSDGKILVGGDFASFGLPTEFRRKFVRIGGEDAS